jgi:hypothetical protein
MAGVAVSGLVHPASVPDAGAFLVRLVRLDPAALVRLRPGGGGGVAMWARLPWEVLVTRTVRGDVDADATVRARDLLGVLTGAARPQALPARHDAAWRWALPPGPGEVVERLPATEVRRIGAAAATTVRTAATQGIGGRPVGSRVLRDALLDHVPIVVEVAGQRVEVGQRLVQAVVRMGFLGRPEPAEPAETVGSAGTTDSESVAIRVAGRWVGLAAGYGTAWQPARAGIITLQPGEVHVK